MIREIKERHSVRNYKDIPINEETGNKLYDEIRKLNNQSGLHIQLVSDEPKAFDGFMAHYGKFSGVKNYIAMVGPKSKDLNEKSGYYGEKLVLFAQSLGLNTCWVAMTYSKIKGVYKVYPGEKLAIVIAVGYGETMGIAHKSKDLNVLGKIDGNTPDWFIEGVRAAALAPTAMNQQKFYLEMIDDKVKISMGMGFYTDIDKGIIKCHFELGAQKDDICWID